MIRQSCAASDLHGTGRRRGQNPLPVVQVRACLADLSRQSAEGGGRTCPAKAQSATAEARSTTRSEGGSLCVPIIVRRRHGFPLRHGVAARRRCSRRGESSVATDSSRCFYIEPGRGPVICSKR